MRTEVLHDGLVVVCSVTKRGNTRKRSKIRLVNKERGINPHYFRTFSPVLSLDFKRSVLSRGSRLNRQKKSSRSYHNVLRNRTRCTFFKRALEQICVNSWSESSIRFVLGSSSRYWNAMGDEQDGKHWDGNTRNKLSQGQGQVGKRGGYRKIRSVPDQKR